MITLSKEDQLLIMKLYPIEGAEGLASKLGKSKDAIRKWANRRGLRDVRWNERLKARPRGCLKKDYFQVWSCEMAYDLGYIAADGTIQKYGLKLCC